VIEAATRAMFGVARVVARGVAGLLVWSALRLLHAGGPPFVVAALVALVAAPRVGPLPAVQFVVVSWLVCVVHRRRARRRRPAAQRQVVVVQPQPSARAGRADGARHRSPGSLPRWRVRRRQPEPVPPARPVAPARTADMTADQLRVYLQAFRAWADAWTARKDRAA